MAPNSTFAHDRFSARKKFISFLGQRFYIFDHQVQLIAFVKQKAFKLKEDIRVFSDESMTREILAIQARSIIDWGAAYDVLDRTNGESVGGLKRKGWKSALLSDEWVMMDAQGQQVGTIKEDSVLMATIRRHVIAIVPQTFNFIVDGNTVGTAVQNWNFFLPKMQVDFTSDAGKRVDRRLALAAVVLLMAIEGRQN